MLTMLVTQTPGGLPLDLCLSWKEGAISWNSRLQPTMAVSTTEAEYMASAQAVREALWLKKLLGNFGIKVGAMPIYTDSQGALKLLKHPIA